ncbi:MAG TPA: serine protease [Ignavibacteria bacterium]
MMKATYQISGLDENGNYVIGSCFIIGKPVKNDSSKLYYVLVTAKHVLRDIAFDKAQIKARIKLSDTSYEVGDWSFDIRKNNKNLYYLHQDSLIDIAAMYIFLPGKIDLDLIPIEYLADDNYLKEINIHPGDNVFCVGFPFGYSSNKYFFPILTDGIISSYPIIPTKFYNKILININIFKGNSGGPVYIYQHGRVIGHNNFLDKVYFKIIGLLSKEYLKTKEYEAGNIKVTEVINMKIAEIVPSIYIKELIESMPEPEY